VVSIPRKRWLSAEFIWHPKVIRENVFPGQDEVDMVLVFYSPRAQETSLEKPRANANINTFVLAASLAWAALNLRTVKFRETRRKFFRAQNIPSAPSAQDNHFRLAFALSKSLIQEITPGTG
jgi:hypothetical protein